MGKAGLVDLEKQFAFCGAYHRNPINVSIHMLLVWPILFTALLLLYFTPTPFNLPRVGFSFLGEEIVLVLNYGFLFTLIYAVFYVCLDFRAGCLAALLCIFCWISISYLGDLIGFSTAWKRLFWGVNSYAGLDSSSPMGCFRNERQLS